MLLDLDTEDWLRPTECLGWDVRAMVGHVLGMAEMAASIREGILGAGQPHQSRSVEG